MHGDIKYFFKGKNPALKVGSMAVRRSRRKKQREPGFGWLRELRLVSQLGISMVLSIAIFFAAGFFLDKWLGSKPVFSLIGIFIGIVSGGYLVYKQIMEVTAKSQAEK